jgi:gluconate 2-dehydrogenase gamma chain
MVEFSRRTLLKATGAIGATMLPGEILAAQEGAAGSAAAAAPTSATQQQAPATYLFFNTEEAAFIEAAVARLIPADERWPGALEAGVPNYIDKQMAGAWGAGERLYRSGPWQQGTPSQGYQLPFTPAELFHTAVAAINKELAAAGTPFARMSADRQDAYLKQLEAGGKDLGGVPSAEFFAELWEATIEGFFADPAYGGNRDMVGWRMIGFPGAYASYYALVDQHGLAFDRPPLSLTANAHGGMHMEPNIPAYLPANGGN